MPPVPDLADQDRVHLQLLADYAWVDYLRGHRLPRSGLAGVGVNLSFALTKRITLAVGYGYGIDAPRHGDFGGQELDPQFRAQVLVSARRVRRRW